MTRRIAVATGLAALALGGLGGIGIAGAQPPPEPNRSRDASQDARQMPVRDDMRDLHHRMIERHREMMRDPDLRALMRSPEMRTMHRDMMRMDGDMMGMHGGMMGMHDDMPETGMGMMD